MERVERIASIVGLLAAVLALTDAFQGFVAGGLFWKMIVIGLACAMFTWAAAGALAARLQPSSPAKPRYGSSSQNNALPRLLAITTLLTLCLLFFGLIWLMAFRQPIRVTETISADRSTAILTASATTPAELTVLLPNRAQIACDWRNTSTDQFPRLDYQVVDISTPSPKLHFDGFVYPQRMQIDCKPPTALRDFKLEPGGGEIFLQDELNRRLAWAALIGGIIWLAASSRLWVLSR